MKLFQFDLMEPDLPRVLSTSDTTQCPTAHAAAREHEEISVLSHL